uniref:Uncharacterized protein n=1 Tax=Monopterus albus TaxID=43700 RepID=A0A3Q3KDG5_MONAL
SKKNPKFDITTISVRFQNISEFPEMNVDVLSHSLSEDTPVGTLVAVVSAVSVRADVSFYLASGNFEDVFHMEQLSGALTVENPLDYENKKEFTLLIEARDSGSPPFSSFAEIHFTINDVNDNFPQFTQVEYRCEVFENSPPSWVCDVLAIDADSGSYSTLHYYITEGNTDNFFTIDPESGLLSTTANLDREYIPEFNLTVAASELDNSSHKDCATVIIVVLDRNDHAPRFSQIFSTQVPEDAPVGHTIIQVTSTDDDAGVNALINYYITDQSDDMPFTIDFTSGYVTVQRLLDREMQDHYILNVNANDSAWSISTDVTIIVTDINDNRPVFSDHFYTTVIPETKDKEVFVLQVHATDADTGQDSEIFYVIQPPNEKFWVNSSSGEIYTKQLLTLHNHSFEIFEFTVFAFDCGNAPLYSNTSVAVRLEPYNHHPPMFLPVQPLIAIPCHMAVGTEVVQLTAIDMDVSNSSANIEYVLNGGNASDFFRIHADSGKVTLNQTLLESINLFLTLIVVAKDQGFPSLSSQTKITFEITGENQFSPSFSEPGIIFSVPEDLLVGSVIGKIQAEDEDDGPNGAIRYCIAPENHYLQFSVGEASGLLKLITELDFEKQGIYHFQIKAMDSGWVFKNGMLNVTVVVMDVNDNPPVFPSAEYLTSVPENSEIGTNVLDVKATDADSGANAHIYYSLIAGHLWPVYNLTVTATDNGSPPATGTTNVIVTIGDVNDNAPKLTLTEAQLKENQPEGTVVARLDAFDLDLPKNQGPFTFWLVSPSEGSAFSLTPDGVLLTTRPTDREQISTYQILVAVRDTGIPPLSSTTMFHISIVDENDNPSLPRNIFIEVKYFGSSFQGGMIGNVHPEDQDESDTFSCSIKSGPQNMFTIPNGTCELLSSSFQGEATFNLTIEATDQLHIPVNNSIYVNYKGFTNASIDNCILFYVASSSMEEFLSHKYLKFVKALDSLFNLQASKTHVFGIKHIGSEILLFAAVKSYNGQYLSREVASEISAGHKKLLEAQSNVTISHINSDPCHTSPCQNGAMCHKNIYISQDVAVLESLAVIFVSPQKEVFNCTCPIGFTGTLCEGDTDECEVDPCENKGTCVNTAGSFYCHCQSGFSGSVCSIDLDECLKVKCQNGETCIPIQGVCLE